MSTATPKIQDVLKIIDFTNNFRLVKRDSLTNDNGRKENDLEHSYQLALLVWYLNSKMKLAFDDSKLIKYALVHDLVETYAGDVNEYFVSAENKKTAESVALKRIKKEFDDFQELTDWITKYEAKNDEESRFVYAIDKITVGLNSLANDDGEYKKAGITLERFNERNESKVMVSEPAFRIYKELMKYIVDNKPDFFEK